MIVEPDNTAHRARVVLKMGMPIGVCEHDIRRAVGAVLIGGMEETAKIRLNPEHVKVVSGYRKARGGRGRLAGVQTYEGEVEGRQSVEAAVAIAQVEIVG